MAVASCFGSPLLSHVVGLSIAMIVSLSSAVTSKLSTSLSYNAFAGMIVPCHEFATLCSSTGKDWNQ